MPNPSPAADSRSAVHSSAAQLVSRIASLAPVEAAAAWFLAHQDLLLERQMEVTAIPAPPFGEAARAEWLAKRFRELGLQDVEIDGIGNVIGLRSGTVRQAEPKYLAITAHIDTVFPLGTGV